jgi:transposase-like protein
MCAHFNFHAACPVCSSEYTVRTHRHWAVKILTSQWKFLCTDCGKNFYFNHLKIQADLSILQRQQVAR